MKVSDRPIEMLDGAISEVRVIKRGISELHGNDIDRLLAALISQERTSSIGKANPDAAGQPERHLCGRRQPSPMIGSAPGWQWGTRDRSAG